MKKKIRWIVVNDIKYAWQVVPNNDGGNIIKIWKNKRVIFSQYLPNNDEIKPSYIAELITAIQDFGDISNK